MKQMRTIITIGIIAGEWPASSYPFPKRRTTDSVLRYLIAPILHAFLRVNGCFLVLSNHLIGVVVTQKR